MSNQNDFEEGQFFDELEINGTSQIIFKDVKISGQELKFLGYILNTTKDFVVIESQVDRVLGPGSLVVTEYYTKLGSVLDVFGPVLAPLYIVKPESLYKTHMDVGLSVYTCDFATVTSVVDETGKDKESGEEGASLSEVEYDEASYSS